MTDRDFAITFDYLCPFARNANERVITALQEGTDWDVDFVGFSLAQAHVDEDQTAVWDRDEPDAESGILALQAGLAVREHDPERFLDAHVALFAARHDDGDDIRDPQVVRGALASAGVDDDAVMEAVGSGKPLDRLREEHTAAVDDHGVWGVPTFVTDDRAVFVRLLDRPDDAATARADVEQVLDLTDDSQRLHEFKQVDLPR